MGWPQMAHGSRFLIHYWRLRRWAALDLMAKVQNHADSVRTENAAQVAD
jgi:hypothetical protein